MSGSVHPKDPETPDAGVGPVLLVLVAKYRDLDIESAARLQAVSSELGQHLLASSSAVSGAVVVSTCSRFEIYCEVASRDDVDTACSEALGSVRLCSGLPAARLASLFEHSSGASAAEHLFAVAAGLDSVVVGERQVTGQVRRALADAQAAGTASGLLVRLFQEASRTGRDVGARTTLSSASRSIASVALELAATGVGHPSLAEASVVLFGTGSYAACVAEILRSKRCPTISVFSQSGRAEAFVASRGGTALTAQELPAAVARADIVIGCSGTETRIAAAQLAEWRDGTGRALTVVDLAPSHDFDPRVADLPGVELITLDSVRFAAPPADAEALRRARTMVRLAAHRFEEREKMRAVDAAIVALRRHVHHVLEAEMERALKQHGPGAQAEDVNLAMRRLVRRLLHLPTVRARELAADGRQHDYAAALEALFGLSVQPAGARNPGTDTVAGLRRPPWELRETGTAMRACGGADTRGGCPGTCPARRVTSPSVPSLDGFTAAPAAS
ncbi:glutamyl-tRNA reductase [Arthrobacter sp. NPDC058130]|uniref:glutamyl-tRNA reductase n=1 Tax=Arthrobacter sp. NPDC058130 TaxID=3346353 RepID=UPI0036EC968B